MKKKTDIACLIRNPRYLRDYAELELGLLDEDSIDHILRSGVMKEKWGISSLVDPKNPPPTGKHSNIYSRDYAVKQKFYRIDRNTSRFRRDGRYILIEIDITKPLKDIFSGVKAKIKEAQDSPSPSKDRNTKDRKLDRLQVWDEYLVLKSFAKIAQKYRLTESTVRKAYYRAFEDIMGEKYDPMKYDRKNIIKEQLRKACDTCKEHPDRGGACDTLCPEALAYVEQDKVNLKELLK